MSALVTEEYIQNGAVTAKKLADSVFDLYADDYNVLCNEFIYSSNDTSSYKYDVNLGFSRVCSGSVRMYFNMSASNNGNTAQFAIKDNNNNVLYESDIISVGINPLYYCIDIDIENISSLYYGVRRVSGTGKIYLYNMNDTKTKGICFQSRITDIIVRIL